VPREKGVTQLDILRRKQAELTEQLKAAEAKDQEREKRLESRRKEIIGGLILEHARDKPETPWVHTLFEIVGSKLTKPADRALFPTLPPMKREPRSAKSSAEPPSPD
jgi:hypothetical protein